MLFAGFNVHEGEYRCGRPSWSVRRTCRVVDRLHRVGTGRHLSAFEKHAEVPAITPSPRVGRPLVRALRRAGRLLRPDAADRPHHLAAGRVARMPFWKFSVTRSGCLPWVFALTFAGQKRPELDVWKDSLHYVDYTVAVLIVLGVVYLAVRWSATATAGAPRMRRLAAPELRHAVALGALHGPTELLPISSSAHTRSSRGCSAGPTPSSIPSCARPSRWRCMPAPRRRCSSACA